RAGSTAGPCLASGSASANLPPLVGRLHSVRSSGARQMCRKLSSGRRGRALFVCSLCWVVVAAPAGLIVRRHPPSSVGTLSVMVVSSIQRLWCSDQCDKAHDSRS
ncbi:unnamed protein product, partial [Amoebophrya sp. A120]